MLNILRSDFYLTLSEFIKMNFLFYFGFSYRTASQIYVSILHLFFNTLTFITLSCSVWFQFGQSSVYYISPHINTKSLLQQMIHVLVSAPVFPASLVPSLPLLVLKLLSYQ